MLILTEDFARVASTAAADQWLATVARSDWPGMRELPQAVYAVAARVQELERGCRAQMRVIPILAGQEAADPGQRVPMKW